MDDLELDINDDDISLEKEFNEEIEYNDFYKKNVRYINLFFFIWIKIKTLSEFKKKRNILIIMLFLKKNY